MDISVFISDLLYEHNCVIVPGFGGFICNYRPAEIHPVLHIVIPPSKSVSFNKNLTSNDGLLVNYIAKTGDLSFQQAHELIGNWASTSRDLLKRNESLNLKKVGRLFCDIEGNIQFTPDESVNYLKSSFALKPITAKPVLRGKEVDFTEKFAHETKKHIAKQSSVWKIAAAIILLAGIGALIQMMRMGVEIKPLGLNEAGIFSFLTHFSGKSEDTMRPIAVATEKPVVTEPITVKPVTESSSKVTVTISDAPPLQPAYYIITGAFAQSSNAEKAQRELVNKLQGTYIFTDKTHGLTRVGYLVSTDSRLAEQKLKEAQVDNPAYWLLRK